FRAEGYQVELAEGMEEAKGVIEHQVRQDIRRDIGGDEQRISNMQIRISDVTFKHVLLPVWVAAYKYRGTTYRFVVNGQTGKVQGERPWSAIKIAIAVVAGLIVAAALIYGYSIVEAGG
ncbi:MAG: primosomal protein N' (replication factor Y) - superfamily II helicase, partial [Roseicyclus sp.]